MQLARRASDRTLSFHELALRWWRTEAKKLVEPANEWRHLNHLEPLWGLNEASLTPRRARDALLSLLKPKGRLSASTVNKVRSTARRAIRDAQMNGEWRGPNPFEVVQPLKELPPAYQLLTAFELKRTIQCLPARRRREALFNLVLGPRPGETRALRKVDVDVRRHVIRVHRSNRRDTTKTGRERWLAVPGWLWPTVAAAMLVSPSEFVFPGPGGKQQSRNTRMSGVLRTAMGKAGVVLGYAYVCRKNKQRNIAWGCGYADIRPIREKGARCPECGCRLYQHPVPPALRYYDLRHCCATLHRKAGCDPLVIALTLGHAVRRTTESDYTHIERDWRYLRKELSKLRL